MKKWLTRSWKLGFIKDSLEDVLTGKSVHFQMVNNPYKDRWFADPFVLDVTDTHIYLLVEEMQDGLRKGRIALLTIDKSTWTIIDVQIVLEEPTHLSFPAILRENGHTYIYPENAGSGVLKMYELQGEKLEYVKTICSDILWDSVITDHIGNRRLFTAHQDDNHLDIYAWNTAIEKFEYEQTLVSEEKNMRMAGDLFELNGKVYCVNQVCNHDYGEAVEIKEVCASDSERIVLKPIRRITPPRGLLYAGLHTMNMYRGVIVVDFHMWNSIAAWAVNKMVKFKKTIKQWLNP